VTSIVSLLSVCADCQHIREPKTVFVYNLTRVEMVLKLLTDKMVFIIAIETVNGCHQLVTISSNFCRAWRVNDCGYV